MLVIRDDQLDRLSEARVLDFKYRLGAHLSSEVPGLPADAIQAIVDKIIGESPAYGLRSELEIAQLGAITARTFGRFPNRQMPPQALSILMSYSLDSKTKLQRYANWAESAKPSMD